MPKPDPVLERVRALCLALPDTKETPTWGKPHFRVGDKIFAGCEPSDSGTVVGFKLEKGHATALIAADPRCTRAPYVGHAGWVSMDLSGPVSWEELRELILESYRLIAPERSLEKLGSPGAASSEKKKRKTASRSVTTAKRAKTKRSKTKKRASAKRRP